MKKEHEQDTQEVTTFEEYTLYSLDESVSGVLALMQRSKQVAGHWPEIPALVEAADLCRDLAALATYMDSLHETLGDVSGASGKSWESARAGLHAVMAQMADDVVLADEGGALKLFGFTLPAALHDFNAVIPDLQEHVRIKYQNLPSDDVSASPAQG